MAFEAQPSSLVQAAPNQTPDDSSLLRLCMTFIASAQARSVEGARLDSLPWSAVVEGGYGQLCRGAPEHRTMLADILASAPATIDGLLAKAHAVRVHQRDPESEAMSYAALADDIVRLFGQGGPRDGGPMAG